MRIGLFGGSFNPAHRGHLRLSREALARLNLDQVWWLVSPQNPLKPVVGMAPFEDRLEAARQLTARDPRIWATDLEAKLGTPFTFETLNAIRLHNPGKKFVWLMGADNLISVHRWRHWEEIFTGLPIAIFARPTYSLRALASRAAYRFAAHRRSERTAKTLVDQKPPAWIFVRMPLDPTSATALRNRSQGRGAV